MGAREGSIIAAIISVHMSRKEMIPIPMVPGILPMCRASRSVNTQAIAARISNSAQVAMTSGFLASCSGFVLIAPPSPIALYLS